MKHVIKLKKKGYKWLTNSWGQKPWRNLWKKMTKILRLDRSKRESEKKFEKAFEIVKNMWGEAFYKTQISNFDWPKLGFDRSKNRFDWSSTNQASIEHRSSQAYSNLIFKHNFDHSCNSLDLSKNWNFEIFEKQSKFYAETTQTNMVHEWNA